MSRRTLTEGDETALVAAVKIPNNAEEIKKLLASEEVERRDFFDMTALMNAAQWGTPDNIEVLVIHGKANLEATDAEGRTALMYAASSNGVDAVRILLKLGANPLAVDIDGKNASDRAMVFKQYEHAGVIQNAIDKAKDKTIPHVPSEEKPANPSPRSHRIVSNQGNTQAR